jgi:ATP-dependent Clp protease adapter protein ClpS
MKEGANQERWKTAAKGDGKTRPLGIPKRVTRRKSKADPDLAPTYYVICWNDPVNLMTYVAHVFMKVFGWNKQKAWKHMKEVHEKGKSVLIREGAEKAEFYVHQLQNYKLHATMEPAK